MSVIDDYLNQFFDRPYEVEEYKINFLRNHYYNDVNKIMNIQFDDLLIGVKKKQDLNRNFIFFTSKKDKNIQVIYNRKEDKYYYRYMNNHKKIIKISSRIFNEPEKIIYEDTIDLKIKKNNKKFKCIIL